MKVIFKNCEIAVQNYPMDNDAKKILDSFSREYTFGEKKTINRYVVGLKQNGLWDKIEILLLPCIAGNVSEAFVNIKTMDMSESYNTSGFDLNGNKLITLQGGVGFNIPIPSGRTLADMHMATYTNILSAHSSDIHIASTMPRIVFDANGCVYAQARKASEPVTLIPRQSNQRKTYDNDSVVMLTTEGSAALGIYLNGDMIPATNSSVEIMDATMNNLNLGDFNVFGAAGIKMFSIGDTLSAKEYVAFNNLTRSIAGIFK